MESQQSAVVLNVKLFMFHVSCSACKCNGHASMCNPSNGKCFCTTKGIKGDRCHLWVLSPSSCFLMSWIYTLTCPLLSTQAAVIRKLSNFQFVRYPLFCSMIFKPTFTFCFDQRKPSSACRESAGSSFWCPRNCKAVDSRCQWHKHEP